MHVLPPTLQLLSVALVQCVWWLFSSPWRGLKDLREEGWERDPFLVCIYLFARGSLSSHLPLLSQLCKSSAATQIVCVCVCSFCEHICMSARSHAYKKKLLKIRKTPIVDLCFSFIATHVERLYGIFRSCIKSSALKGELSRGMSCILWSYVLAGFDVYSLCRAAGVCARISRWSGTSDGKHQHHQILVSRSLKVSY